METREVVLVDYARTPEGRGAAKGKPGFFDACRSDELAIVVIEDLIRRTGIDRTAIDGIYSGSFALCLRGL